VHRDPAEFASQVLRSDWEALSETERAVIEHVLQGARISRNTIEEYETRRTFGARLADRIASFGGSWTFILLFLLVLGSWIMLNSVILVRGGDPFDPYPFILLNLFLSMIAAIQAPIILMSQNRAATRDRLAAAHDYEVNLKAEIEIRALHEKLDLLREGRWAELVEMQQQQIQLLQGLQSGSRDDDRETTIPG
jgi:uncharacterized membrane protein